MTESFLKDPARLLAILKQDINVADRFHHNMRHLRLVHGAHRLTVQNRVSFDPCEHYWRRPARRALVRYLATRGLNRFAPADALRELALILSHEVELVEVRHRFASWLPADYQERWGEVVTALETVVPNINQHGARAWSKWSSHQKTKHKLADKAGDDFIAFVTSTLTSVGRDGKRSWTEGKEDGFRDRVPWFHYLGATRDDVESRRAFFFGWANLFCSTNAYRFAGSQNFAPMLQNTPLNEMLNAVDPWFLKSEAPTPPKTFRTHGKMRARGFDKPFEAVNYSTVSELWGLASLHSAPYVNGLNRDAFRHLLASIRSADVPDIDNFELSLSLGAWVKELVHADPSLASHLEDIFTQASIAPLSKPVVSFETIAEEPLSDV